MMYHPSREQFCEMSRRGNLIPVYREILADMETPVSAFLKIDHGDYAFLLESVEGGERVARYSFIGSVPSLIFTSKGRNVTRTCPATGDVDRRDVDDPFRELEEVMSTYVPVAVEGLPRFHGGAVGYISYDMVRFFEHLPDTTEDDLDMPDSVFMLTDTVLVFDRVSHKVKVVSNAHVPSPGDAEAAYDSAVTKIDGMIDLLQQPQPWIGKSGGGIGALPKPTSNMSQEAFEQTVRAVKEYIEAGDVIQVVTSQRFTMPLTVEPFEFYRALRTLNPSPYMYYLKMGDLQIAGASPEMTVRVEDGVVQTRPIAGTRPRGATRDEDDALERELIADPKERAEHVMLVDLARNDIGRVCEYGSVHLDEFMAIERYSHVMHIVSTVAGALRSDKSAFDVMRASFPVGTLSGAPKIRAMEIIDELEPTRRGPYGGAVGYFSFGGNADTAIVIRTLVMKGGQAYVQAGGGIVADSVPAREYAESCNKARAVLRALEIAHEGLS